MVDPTRCTTVSLGKTPSTALPASALTLKFKSSDVTTPIRLYFEEYLYVAISYSFPSLSVTTPVSLTSRPSGRGLTISVGKGVSTGISPLSSGVSVGFGVSVTSGDAEGVGVSVTVGVVSGLSVSDTTVPLVMVI